jgi:hypothetical protein
MERFAQAVTEAERVDGSADVAFLRSMQLPGDELALFVFQAPSIDVVIDAHRRAQLSINRITEAIDHAGTVGSAAGRR